jgi:hypothetical protein
MIRLFENHWGAFKPFLLYKDGETVSEKPQSAEGKEVTQAEVTAETPRNIWDKEIEPEYGMEAFENKMKAEADKIYRESVSATAAEAVPEGSFSVEKEDLLRRSVQDYGNTYEATMKMFFRKGGELTKKREDAIEKVESKTREELAELRAEMGLAKESDNRAREAVNVGKELKTWLDAQQMDIVRYINKKEIKDRFEDYVTALNDFYLDEDWDKTRLAMPVVYNETGRTASERSEFHIPILKPDLTRKSDLPQAYKERSKFLKGRFEDIFEAKLDYLLSKKDTNLDTLKTFQKEIEDTYKRYAGFDKRPGAIDLNDIAYMQYKTSPEVNLVDLLNTNGDNINVELLEMYRLMNPERWDEAMEFFVKSISSDAEQSGMEKPFIDAANELSGKKFEDFDDAKKYIEKEGAKYAKIGVKESLDFVNFLREKVNAERIDILKGVQPPSLAEMAYYERERLLSRRLVPQDDREKLLVEFVSTGREGREMIMKQNGDLLFKTIKNIQTHYKAACAKISVPNDKNKLVFRKSDRESPKPHDVAARLQALIMIAKEAELIARNLGTPATVEKMNNINADKEPVLPGTRFTDTRKIRNAPYRSALYRGGLNGRDLGINAVKVYGAFVVFMNVLNSVRAGWKGDNLIDKITNSLGAVATNPMVLAGTAVTVGAQTLSMNPEYYGYLQESAYGRLWIDSTRKLRRLCDGIGRSNVKNFVHNENEWMTMDKLTADQIKSMMKEAQKRNPKSPMVTKADIEKVIQDKEVLVGIPEGNTNAGMRYRFYASFLTGREKPNIGQLKEICQKNKMVS